MTVFATSRTKPVGVCSIRSPSATMDLEWAMRVVIRSSTGVSKRSLISKAARVKSFASWESAGSSMGILASRA